MHIYQNKLVSSSTNRYQDLIKITGQEQANPSTYNNVPQTKIQLTFSLKVEEAKLLSEKMLLLHATPFSPIYKLHSTVDIIGKSHSNCKRHCNRWDLLRKRRRFDEAFQPIYDLIASIGRHCQKNTWRRVETTDKTKTEAADKTKSAHRIEGESYKQSIDYVSSTQHTDTGNNHRKFYNKTTIGHKDDQL